VDDAGGDEALDGAGRLRDPARRGGLAAGGPIPHSHARPDGTLRRLTGVYRAVDAPKRLVYTWRWEDDPAFPDTLVTVEFVKRGAATEVVLTHEAFPDAAARQRHAVGWTGCFDKLAHVLAAP
jgi:uncharacterized protein YndB with AHSA1/START domain